MTMHSMHHAPTSRASPWAGTFQGLLLAGGLGLAGYLLLRWLTPTCPVGHRRNSAGSQSFGMLGGESNASSTWAGGHETRPGRPGPGVGEGIEGESSVPVMGGSTPRGPRGERG